MSECTKYTFTVFTATYNRAYTLHRVYESLIAQTFHDFEWLIGDDGSTDGTDALVTEWQNKAEFKIHYFREEHAGKNFVFNRGVKEACGEYFAVLDSDDALKPEALDRAYHYWNQLPDADKKKYFSILFFCEDENGNTFGRFFKQSPYDYDFRKFVYSRKFYSERWPCFRTEVLRHYPFREDVKNCHIFESTVWCEIAKKYKARFVNDVARIFYQDVPSLTRQVKHPMHNLEGMRLTILYNLNNSLDFFLMRPLLFLRAAMNFSRFSLHSKIMMAEQYASLNSSFAKALWFVTLPFAVCVFYLDLLRGRTPENAKK